MSLIDKPTLKRKEMIMAQQESSIGKLLIIISHECLTFIPQILHRN